MRTLAIYRARAGFYVGQIVLLAAIPFSPLGKSYFMWLVVAPSIVTFLGCSVMFILLSYGQSSFRNPDEYESLFGIRATTLWWTLGSLGAIMMASFPWAMNHPPSIPLWIAQAGAVVCLGVAELALLRREARKAKS
jgi:hypothetical protein